jgi:hypothetical protein
MLDATLLALSIFPDPKNPFFWLKDIKVRDKFIQNCHNAAWQLSQINKLDQGYKSPYNYAIPF